MPNSWRGRYYRYREFFLNVSVFYKQRTDLKKYLELFLTLTTICIFSVFALRPTIITILDLTKEINTKKATINQMDAKIADLKNAQVITLQKKQELALLDLAIPDNPGVNDFVKQTEALAGQNNLFFKTFSIDKTTIKGPVPDKTIPQEGLPFSFAIEGEYTTLNQFLVSLAKILRPNKLEGLKIAKTKLDNPSVLTLTVSGKAPYLFQSNEN